jgi:LEA14-like dessication related protein
MIKKLIGVLLLILLLWGGYVAYAFLTAKPLLEAHWGEVTENSVDVVVSASLGKPLLLPVSIDEMAISFSGVKVASLEDFKYSPLSKNAEILVRIDSRKLVKSIENYLDANQRGEAEIEVKLGLFGLVHPEFNISQLIQQDVLSQLNFTAQSRPVLGGLLYTPSVEGTEVRWLGAENGLWHFKVYVTMRNPNSVPLALSNVEFELFANGIKIGRGQVSEGVVFPANGVATVPIDTVIDSEVLPAVIAEHIKNGEESTVRADFYITVSASGRNTRIKLASEEETVKTDIMVSINEALSRVSFRE